MKKRVVCFFKYSIFSLLAVVLLFGFCFSYNCMSSQILLSNSISNTGSYEGLPNFFELVKNFFDSPFKNKDDKNLPQEYVYLGGFPIGITIENDGVVVIAKGSVTTKTGEANTSFNSDIKAGDMLVKLGNEKISSISDISLFLETKYDGSGILPITLVRDGVEINTHIYPAFDVLTNKLRLGLWVRDSASGVGTMTFIKENGEYSALGHPISDIDTASKISVKDGNIYKCNIIGSKKGAAGQPGELRGLFLRNTNSIGSVCQNTNFGIRGEMDKNYLNDLNLTKVQVGRKGSVKTGKAKILSTIDGVIPEEFEIEIVKTSLQNSPDNRSMIIHVTDKKLIERTGGIVQGMSGSPIIQDGKIVGAVTHVFVNDPTRGYGLYMDWMLN